MSKFIITCKYLTPKGYVLKTLCGRDPRNVEFIRDRDATDIWKFGTREAANRFIAQRPGFCEARNAIGGLVVIREVLS